MAHRCLSLLILLSLAAGLSWSQGINTPSNRNDWEEINFEFNSSVLVDGFPSLLRLAELLQANPGYRVRVEGHTDGIGTASYNQALGMARATAVRDFLVKYGASPSQITTSSQGKEAPKVTPQGTTFTRTDEARYMNRRVVLTVTDAQGNVVGAGGAGDAIRGIDAQLQKLQDCCDQILKRLDKLDEIAAMLKDLADQNAQLRRDLENLRQGQDALRQAQQALQAAAGPAGAAGAPGQPGVGGAAGGGAGAAGSPSAADIARAVRQELDNQVGAGRAGAGGRTGGSGISGPSLQLLGLNGGSDGAGNVSFNGRGRFFAPFGDSFGFQAQAEYYYIRGQREGQFDFGLVDRLNRRVQAGLFASFKNVSLTGNQSTGTLGQASLVADYFFGRGKVGLFGTKAFLDNALINRANGISPTGVLQRNIIYERYLKVVDQAGISGTVGLLGNTYAEGNLAYLRSTASSNRAGGSLRFVFPMNDKFAFTVEGGVNETLLPAQGTQQGRAAVGFQLGNFLRPKEYLAAATAVPMDVPRVRYETLTKRIRIGNDAPVADAGPDRTVQPGTVTLDGANSYDPDGDPITYQWIQETGAAAALSGATSARASFIAAAGQLYTFRLVVKDDQGGQSSARVRISTTTGDRVQILFFTADPRQVSSGQPATLSWRVLNADSVSISGIGAVAATGSVPVSPTATTTYVLTARNSINEESATATVVVAGAAFGFCYASPASIAVGESTTLNWSTTGATAVSIAPGIGAVALSGSRLVSPTQDTTYTLTATGGSRTDSCTIAVRVGSGGGTGAGAPVINRFSANPATIELGRSSTLDWVVTGATSVTITTLGNVALSGNREVSPAATTTYVLTATNSAGTSTAQTTVTVSSPVVPPQVLSFTADPAESAPGAKVNLTCRTTGAETVQIGAALFKQDNVTFPVFPTQDTTYTCVATNARGETASRTVSVKVTPPGPGPIGPPPVINIKNGDYQRTVIRFITLDASGSMSPNGNNPLTYRWTTNDPISISDSTSPTPFVTLGFRMQVYTLQLTVTDSRGQTSSKTVQIELMPPPRQ